MNKTSRTFGWVQDGGSFENLKRILLAMLPSSSLNRQLRENFIPRYVPERYNRNNLIIAITGKNCDCIPYELLKGCGSANQLTAEENIEMFGYTPETAYKIVKTGGRGNAACTGIAQMAVPAQKKLPNGQNKPYQGDWQAECFLRWGVSLGFIDYHSENDFCKVSELGKKFAEAAVNSNDEQEIIGEAMMSYPPAYRIL